LGAKPVVTVNQEKIEFERALIDKTNMKTLILTNTSAIPVHWRLTGCDKLPEEFEVSMQKSEPNKPLKPCGV
jgi:hypothetical protein